MTEVPAAAAALDADVDEIEAVDPANEPFKLPPPTDPPTEEERQPVLDLSDIEGLWPEDVVESAPAPVDAATPEEALEGAKLLPEEGSASVDVFGVGPDDTSHVAVIYPEDVNKLQADGEWRDIKVALTKEPDGWAWKSPSGTSSFLPTTLSADAPVTFSVPAGRLSLSPKDGKSLGEATEEAVTYPDAFPEGADLRYTAVLGGLVEHIVVPKVPSSSTFSYDVTADGLALRSNEHGGVDVLDAAGSVVAVFPAPVAYDAAEEPNSSTGAFTLSEVSEGGYYTLAVTIDPEFLKTATYPVEIDPTWDDAANRDGFTDQSNPTVSYESNQYLQVDGGERSYLRYQTGSIDEFDLVVYDATMFVYPQGSGGVTGGIDAKRVSGSWPSAGTLKWNNQPSVGSVIDTTSSAGTDPWWDWDLDELYQHYLDLGSQWNPHWDNEGVALTAANPKTFHAVDSTLGDSEPRLYVTYNNPPDAPTLNSPVDDYISESDSLTLRADGGNQWPDDPDGDDVLLGIQISDNGTDWEGQHLVYASPYNDAKSFTVPSGVLLDGHEYWWRAVSRDVCAPPDGLCSLTDGAGTQRDPEASNVRAFTVTAKRYGTDDQWHMWSHGAGSDMTLQVNGSNGNLFLDVPLESFPTPIGDLEIGLSYNSQRPNNYGLSPGWDLAIGPRGQNGALPVRLTKLDTGNDADIKIRFRSGRTLYFPHQTGKLWGATSAMSGFIRQAKNGQYTYKTSDGSVYLFAANAISDGSPLLEAKPSRTEDESTNKEFDYTYNTSDKLTKVTDPLGRAIDVAYDNGLVSTITTTGFGNQVFTFAYTEGKLTSISTSVDNPSVDPPIGVSAIEERLFTYVVSGVGAGLLWEVRDGAQTAPDDGWDITYLVDPSEAALTRVSTIIAPSSGAPSSAPTPWYFRYGNVYTGTTVNRVCITDPRGSDNPCDGDFDADPAYETQIEFTTGGYPVKIVGPHGPSDSYRRVSTYTFDNHNNLLCERSPEANAILESCSSDMNNNQDQYIDLDKEGLSTVYDYINKAPYRLKTITRPAPKDSSPSDPQSYPRLQETYVYDGGTTFDGAMVELYENDDLSGLPDSERLWTNLDHDWDQGNPPSISGGANHWGLRLSSVVDMSSQQTGKKYKFRVFSDDGVRLAIEGSTILDCFGQANAEESTANCGEGDVSKVVWGSEMDLDIEYSDITGDAAMTVKWDQGNGNWEVIPGGLLRPDFGLVTQKIYSKVTSATNTVDLWREEWSYGTDALKFRRLHNTYSREDMDNAPSYQTSYTYDTTYGRVLTETKGSNSSSPQTTTFDWLDGTAPGTWAASGQEVSCLQDVTDQSGDVVQHQCDPAGSTVMTTHVIDDVPGTRHTTDQTRTSVFEFDSVGRPTKTEQVETGARTITIYDEAGRVAESRTLISGTTEAVTAYAYDHAGHLKTETLPDPDGGGSATSPVISHEWNWVDLETKRIDERSKQWVTAYDAENRAVSQTSPLGAVTTTAYQLGSSTNQIVVNAPSDADNVTTFDVLGRTTSEKLESYQATTYDYDVLGNVTSMTDPANIRTDHTFTDVFLPKDTISFAQSTSPSTTSTTYDDAGRVLQVNGPLVDDTITYGYDSLWRNTSVTYEGVTLPSSTTKASVSVAYSDAGEQLKVSQPLTTSTTMTREWTYDHAGRQLTYTDSAGTTTTTYNEAGWVTQVADPRPQTGTVHFGYDNLGRRVCRYTATCTPATTDAESWAYDAAGNMTQAKNATTFNMTYDDDGRLYQTERGSTLETTYNYAPTTAQLTSVVDAAGTTAFTYNAAGQMHTVDDPFAASNLKTEYGYETTSGKLVTRLDAQADMTWTRAFDSGTGRLDTQTIQKTSNSATLASFDLGYDPAGNVTSKASTVFANPSNTTWSYTYDPASRLTKAIGENAAGAATTWDYTYDGGGNRIGAKTTTGSVVSNLTTTYNSRGLPTIASDSVTGETIDYAHDAVGNLTLTDSDVNTNDWAQAFDAYGRMTCAEQAATTCTSETASVQFTFDALDRALTRDDDDTTTDYTYSGISEQLAAQTVAGTTTTTFASTPGGHPMAQKVGTAEASYHLLDTHSDVVGLVSTSAANQGTTSYDAYGGVLATTGTQGILGYQGDITDAATKQVDMGTRWYAPGQGRFTSRDVLFGELSSPMSLNQFAYAGGNPITMWDPTGMRPSCRPECDSDTEKDITDDYSDTANEGGGGYTCNCYDPSPSPPDPAPAITYVRESGDYVQYQPEQMGGTIQVGVGHSLGDSLCADLVSTCALSAGAELGSAAVVRYGVRQATQGLLGDISVFEKFPGGFSAYLRPRMPLLAGSVGGAAAQLWEDRNLNLTWQKRILRAAAVIPASAGATAAGGAAAVACARGGAALALGCGFVASIFVQASWEKVEDDYFDAIGLEPDAGL